MAKRRHEPARRSREKPRIKPEDVVVDQQISCAWDGTKTDKYYLHVHQDPAPAFLRKGPDELRQNYAICDSCAERMNRDYGEIVLPDEDRRRQDELRDFEMQERVTKKYAQGMAWNDTPPRLTEEEHEAVLEAMRERWHQGARSPAEVG